MYICICHGISDKKIKKLVIEEGISDVRGIKKCTALGSQCGKCVRATKEIIDDTLSIQFKQAS